LYKNYTKTYKLSHIVIWDPNSKNAHRREREREREREKERERERAVGDQVPLLSLIKANSEA
jgi:hypothetical protein